MRKAPLPRDISIPAVGLGQRNLFPQEKEIPMCPPHVTRLLMEIVLLYDITIRTNGCAAVENRWIGGATLGAEV